MLGWRRHRGKWSRTDNLPGEAEIWCHSGYSVGIQSHGLPAADRKARTPILLPLYTNYWWDPSAAIHHSRIPLERHQSRRNTWTKRFFQLCDCIWICLQLAVILIGQKHNVVGIVLRWAGFIVEQAVGVSASHAPQLGARKVKTWTAASFNCNAIKAKKESRARIRIYVLGNSSVVAADVRERGGNGRCRWVRGRVCNWGKFAIVDVLRQVANFVDSFEPKGIAAPLKDVTSLEAGEVVDALRWKSFNLIDGRVISQYLFLPVESARKMPVLQLGRTWRQMTLILRSYWLYEECTYHRQSTNELFSRHFTSAFLIDFFPFVNRRIRSSAETQLITKKAFQIHFITR